MTVFPGFGTLVGPAKIHMTPDMFEGKTLAIDISCWFHQFFSYHGESEVKFAKAICMRAEKLDGMKVKAIYVFDGKPNPDKKLEDDRRKAERHKNPTKSNKAIPWYFRMAAFKALHEKGYDAIFARHEADHQCAHLVRTCKADAVMSVDFDYLTLGVPMITKVVWSQNGIVSAQLFTLENFKKWTPDQVLPCTANWFLDLIARLGVDAFMIASLLLRCDYIKKIDGFGNAKLKSLAPHLEGGTPRHIMDALRKWLESNNRGAQKFANYINDQLEKDLTFAYNAFMYPPVFDVDEQHMRRLNECPDDMDEAALLPLDDGEWLRCHTPLFLRAKFRGPSRGGDEHLEDGGLRPLFEYYLSNQEETAGNLGFMGLAALGVRGGVAG